MSNGMPMLDGSLGDFAPGGSPDKLNGKGSASTDAPVGESAMELPGGMKGLKPDESLSQFAGISKRTRSSSMKNDGESIDIPKEGDPNPEALRY